VLNPNEISVEIKANLTAWDSVIISHWRTLKELCLILCGVYECWQE